MTCSGRYAEAVDYAKFDCSNIDLSDPDKVAELELYLDLASADVHSARSSAGACDCSLAPWATDYLKKLTMIDASVIQQCPCSQMTIEAKNAWLIWLSNQLELIRTGQIELCDGETGTEYPAFADVARAWTDWSAAEIIYKTLQKTP